MVRTRTPVPAICGLPRLIPGVRVISVPISTGLSVALMEQTWLHSRGPSNPEVNGGPNEGSNVKIREPKSELIRAWSPRLLRFLRLLTVIRRRSERMRAHCNYLRHGIGTESPYEEKLGNGRWGDKGSGFR